MSPPSTDGPHLVTGSSSKPTARALLTTTTTTTTTTPSSSHPPYLSPATPADTAAAAASPYSASSPLHHPPHHGGGREASAMSAYTPSETRPDGGGIDHQRAPSDDGSGGNPLKRRNTEAVDYPRRRATIAVGLWSRKSRRL
jgi:hypothetical protein